jgi:hypothetical protein
MSEVKIPPRILTTLMNALSSGVVPRRGLEYIAVGRKKETETFVNDLDDTAAGGGAFRFISGRFGNGKSFMTQMVRNYAMDRGFVVMDADLATDRRLSGTKDEGLNTYRELIKNTAYKPRPEGGAMEAIIRNWVLSAQESIAERRGCDPSDVEPQSVAKELRRITSEMSSMQFYQDFIKAVALFAEDIIRDSDSSPALRWLKGEYRLKGESRTETGISNIISDGNWYEFIKLWTGLFVCFGFKGLVVFLDEGVVLYKIQNKVSRSNNYERLLSMFNDIMQGKSSHLSMYVCGTPEFIEDPNRGLYSYEALRSRLVAGRYENGYDNYLGPVINLHPLSDEEIFVLIRRIRDLHEQRYGYDSGIDDDMMLEYLRVVLGSSISSSMITPREITRDFISLLDTLHQNPDADFMDMISGRKVAADDNPDDDIIEDLEI